MNSQIGNKISYSLFGESHGDEIGIVITGLKSGIKIDYDFIREELSRRRPKKNNLTTNRIEEDEFRIVSGVFNGKTSGSPLTIIIENKNIKSKDYDEIKEIARPSHADFSANEKYNGFQDYRGSGHFSGRITAPLVCAGAIIKTLLKEEGIEIYSHILSVKDVNDNSFSESYENGLDFKFLREKELMARLPVIDKNGDVEEKIKETVLKAKEEKDSVGGVIECMALNVKTGVGNPFFYSLESVISHFIFSVPGIKAIEFGDGIEMSKMQGSMSNDSFYIDEGKVKTKTNHSGGINGGISNGMPIVFKAFVKPTSSIGKVQDTINLKTMENTKLEVVGRHDPCIALRMCPVIEAAFAMAIYELL